MRNEYTKTERLAKANLSPLNFKAIMRSILLMAGMVGWLYILRFLG